MLRLKDSRECNLTQTRFLTQNSEQKTRPCTYSMRLSFLEGVSHGKILTGSDHPSSEGEPLSIPITRYRLFDTFRYFSCDRWQEANILSVCVCVTVLTSKEAFFIKSSACNAGVFHGRALNNKFSSRIRRRLRGRGKGGGEGGGAGNESEKKKGRPANPV